MKDATPTKSHAIFSLIGFTAAVVCLGEDIYLLISSHPPHNQTLRIAFLPLLVGGAAVFFSRYRHTSVRKTTQDPTG